MPARIRHPFCGRLAVTAAVALASACWGPIAPAAADPAIDYETFFQDPGTGPVADYSLEEHTIDLIDATPSGARITFTLRDFNRMPITDALISAHERGVTIDGVVDGGERDQEAVIALQEAVGPERFVVCGSPLFEFNSCIANSQQFKPSLQHNKFMTFSSTGGRENVVLQTSQNFFEPQQYTYYNDMVEITGDRKLHDDYARYLHDLKAQVRSDDHYDGYVTSGDDGANTMFPSPRRQANVNVDDTIVDRMNEIDCSEGGRIHVANHAFRTERAVIMRKLVALQDEGCSIDVISSNVDGPIIAGLVAARVPFHPFVLRARPGRPEVRVHSKYWLVDAKSTVTGRRTKVTYAGSSNWRADQQYSDDLLLRIVNDGVYDAYLENWDLLRSRAASDPLRRPRETVRPASALATSPETGSQEWTNSDVTVRIAASDGHNVNESGLKRLHVEMSGAQSGSWDFLGDAGGYNVQELQVTAEGKTTVTWFAEDNAGNREPVKTHEVWIDKTAPAITGLPDDCELWPPNHRLVHVADIAASDPLSGLDGNGLAVSGWSNAESDEGDVVISGGSVDLRAEKAERGASREYELLATATDSAGNTGTAAGTCVVPHSRGNGGR